MNGEERQQAAAEEMILQALVNGSLPLPYAFLKYYKKMGIGDMEAMVLIQTMAFQEKEQKPFPTLEEIAQRMTAAPEQIAGCMQRLVKMERITIDEQLDPLTGVYSESYNLLPLWREIASLMAEASKGKLEAGTESAGRKPGNSPRTDHADKTGEMFSVFETEFGRPLSPMECETISAWLDQDKYPQELILLALKEAVFSGKVHFRYIDRILLEWSRNRIRTAEEAKAFSRNFRGGR